MSDLSRHGSALPRPMMPFSAIAATRTTFILLKLLSRVMRGAKFWSNIDDNYAFKIKPTCKSGIKLSSYIF